MHFTSALTSFLLASTAAALPPQRVGVTSTSTNGTELYTRSALNLTEPAAFVPRSLNLTEPAFAPRSLNLTGKPILARSLNFTSAAGDKAVFPRLSLDKNTTEGIFAKRDAVDDVEGVAAPSGVFKRDAASPTGYVKRSFGTGEVPVVNAVGFSTFLTASATSPLATPTSTTSSTTPTPERGSKGRGGDAVCGAGGGGMDVWDRCIEALLLGFGH